MGKVRVVAAIDFGTHGTGFAWAVINERNRDVKARKVAVNVTWPGQPIAYPKNLTALLLSPTGEVVAWGYDARKKRSRPEYFDHIYEARFKMRLAPQTQQLDIAERSSTSHAYSTEYLIEVYLKKMYERALETITAGDGYRPDDIRWCLTVPAIWDDRQKQEMREAAIRAGLPGDPERLVIALEPEAAAHYVRVAGVHTGNFTNGRRVSLGSPNSRFMVVDCGGGTIDITSYSADSKGKLTEIGNDCGDALGSEYVNDYLKKNFVASRLGEAETAELIENEYPAMLELMDCWERAKLEVGPDSDDDVILHLNALARKLSPDAKHRLAQMQDGIDYAIVLRPDEITECFESVVPGILAHIDKQLQVMANGRRSAQEVIVLVGGFAESPYLKHRIREHVKGRAHVMELDDPKGAVLYGAAHYAYDPQTRARKTKYTYGYSIALPFVAGIDPANYKFTDEEGRVLCENRFNILAKARETIDVDSVRVATVGPTSSKQSELVVSFYRTPVSQPRYTTDTHCTQSEEIVVDLKPVLHLPYKQRAVEVRAKFGETQIHATAQCLPDGPLHECTIVFDAVM
ncbi:Hsp70 family protein [Catellatospora aurea]|uniref:Hsp70 family protein n=1 Tax=Catellatospora aurea TaxID=1337874 RepID=A0ABW2H8R4_9ACTN